MRHLFSTLFALCIAFAMYGQDCATAAWINEFHYDNTGGDVNEFVEVVLAPSLNAADYEVQLYNGSNGTQYGSTVNLGTAAMTTDAVSGFQIFVVTYPANGLQNGAPDGIALVNNGTVVEFLSYEGDFTATNGDANGESSTNVGVSETSGTAVGTSLQRNGTGNVGSDFTFSASAAETPGALNTSQTITTCTPPAGCSITLINVTEPACQESPFEDQSNFTVTFNVTGGSGQYFMSNPDNNILNGSSGPPGGQPTDGIVSFVGQADITGNTEGEMATVRLSNSVNPSECFVDFTINVPICPEPGCAEEDDIFINEIHYDNVGNDVNEFVEVAVSNLADIDIADFTLSLYNGSSTQRNVYNSITVDMMEVGEDDGTYTYYSWCLPSNGIQNGAPDGLSLSCTDGLVEFLSYEGTFEAASGPAMGETSTNLGVAESSATGEFASLQLIDGVWAVTGCNTKGAANADVPAPAAPAVGVGFKAVCKGDFDPSLATSGISADISLEEDEKVVWVIFGAPAGSGYNVGDEFTVDECGDPFKNFGDFAVANSSKVIRVQDATNLAAGNYSFEVFTENCATGCRSISEIGFTISVSEAPSVMITADPDGDICLGTMGVQYDAVVTSTDGGTYGYTWCAYNSGDGSGNCFDGFSDNTAQMPTRNWTTSAGPKSVGVVVESENAGCSAEALYSFNVVAPAMVECPADQNVTLETDDVTFDCATPVDFNNPMVGDAACGPYTLTISVDGGAAETVIPGDLYTLIVDDLGTINVVYTLTDGVGNVSTCDFDVIVEGLPCGFVDNGGFDCANNTSDFDPTSGEFTLTSDCAPAFPYTSDRGAFVFTELCEDGEIVAKVENLDGTGFAGIMMRETEAADARKIAMSTNTVDRLFREVRVFSNYPAFPQQIFSLDKFWLRITREQGFYFKAFASVDGVNWIPYAFQAIQMDGCLKVGLFVSSDKEGVPATGTFSNVSVTPTNVGSLQTDNKDVAQSDANDATLGTGTAPTFAPANTATANIGLTPNPARDIVTLNLDQVIGEEAIIRIFNINGQLMNQFQFDSVEDANQDININELPAGTYYVNVRTTSTQQTLKLIKQ